MSKSRSLRISVSVSAILIILILMLIFFSMLQVFGDDMGKTTNTTNVKNNYTEIGLTDVEINYIEENRVFYYTSETKYAPIEYINENGDVKGFGIQYLEYAQKLLGVDFLPYPGMETMDWATKLQLLQDEEIDIMTSISMTDDRKKYVNFTKPYLTANIIVIGNDDSRLILDNKDMKGKSFAFPSNYWQNDYAVKNIEDIRIVNTSDMKEAFCYIDEYLVDYTFLESTVYNFLMQGRKYKNIKIVGELDYHSMYHIGISKNKEILRDILNKVIEASPKELVYSKAMIIEKEDEVSTKWLGLNLFLLFVLLIIIFRLAKKLFISKKYHARLERNKIELIENLSHDLKTPLTALKVNVSLLNYGLIEKENISKYYHKLDQQIDMINGIIDELYEVIQMKEDIVENRLSKTLEMVRASEFATRFYEEKRAYVQSQMREFIFLDNTKEKSYIKIDIRDIYRVLTNLLMNAMKFTTEGEAIVIEIKEEQDNVIFIITDYGTGIKNEDLPYIFERFYQADSKNISKGKGLGLYISNKLVQINHGKIKVKTHLNEFTSFYITFPKY